MEIATRIPRPKKTITPSSTISKPLHSSSCGKEHKTAVAVVKRPARLTVTSSTKPDVLKTSTKPQTPTTREPAKVATTLTTKSSLKTTPATIVKKSSNILTPIVSPTTKITTIKKPALKKPTPTITSTALTKKATSLPGSTEKKPVKPITVNKDQGSLLKKTSSPKLSVRTIPAKVPSSPTLKKKPVNSPSNTVSKKSSSTLSVTKETIATATTVKTTPKCSQLDDDWLDRFVESKDDCSTLKELNDDDIDEINQQTLEWLQLKRIELDAHIAKMEYMMACQSPDDQDLEDAKCALNDALEAAALMQVEVMEFNNDKFNKIDSVVQASLCDDESSAELEWRSWELKYQCKISDHLERDENVCDWCDESNTTITKFPNNDLSSSLSRTANVTPALSSRNSFMEAMTSDDDDDFEFMEPADLFADIYDPLLKNQQLNSGKTVETEMSRLSCPQEEDNFITSREQLVNLSPRDKRVIDYYNEKELKRCDKLSDYFWNRCVAMEQARPILVANGEAVTGLPRIPNEVFWGMINDGITL